MNIRIIILIGLSLLLFGCNKDTVVPIPSAGTNSIIKDTHPLKPASKLLMEGVYRATSGSGDFGDYMVVKWNRTSLSFACNNGKHFIMDAGYLDSVVFVQGYWRDGYSDATGLCTMYISKSEGGTSIVTGNGSQQIFITRRRTGRRRTQVELARAQIARPGKQNVTGLAVPLA